MKKENLNTPKKINTEVQYTNKPKENQYKFGSSVTMIRKISLYSKMCKMINITIDMLSIILCVTGMFFIIKKLSK